MNGAARFCFASLVSSNGGIPPYSDFKASGPAHAKAFLDLINKGEAGDWDYR